MMSQRELTGNRSLTFSAWHRAPSLGRFIPKREAHHCSLIDIDFTHWVECEDGTFEPVAFLETAQYKTDRTKPHTMLSALGRNWKRPIECYVVLYKEADWPNPMFPAEMDIE